MSDKIDSNITGLRFAEETSIKVVDPAAKWYLLEPNSYSDFGGQITTVARNPINPSRQRKKGVTTDLDASGGFQQDMTTNNSMRLLQGFFFADAKQLPASAPLDDAGILFPPGNVSTTDDSYAAPNVDDTTLAASDLIYVEGYANSANNGLKTVATIATDKITVSENLVTETFAGTASIEQVGHVWPSGAVALVISGPVASLTKSSGADFDDFGIEPGDWVYVGGDGAGNQFSSTNHGFARVYSVAAALLEFDKCSWTPVAHAGTSLTMQLFFGTVIKNALDPANIFRRTYQLERTLGNDNDGVMSEYLVGAVPSELTLNVPQAEKITLDLSFIATDNEQYTGAEGVKSGTRVSLAPADAFNSSNDFTRIHLTNVVGGVPSVSALFAYATELTITLSNNLTPNKAVGVLGAFDVSAGTFEVGGSITAYFASIEAVQAVRNNEDITLDMILVKANKGIVWDIPLMSLGNGRLNVEQDQPITLPLDQTAAESSFGHTLLFQYFPYLPTIAN